MKAIEGVDIKQAAQRAQEMVRLESCDLVARQIRELLSQQINASQKVGRLENDLEKAHAVLEKLNQQVARVTNGDWSAVPDKKEPGKTEELAAVT